MNPALRVTREYFLADSDLKRTLKLPPSTIILSVEHKHGTYKGRGRGDQSIDLEGCLVTTSNSQGVLGDRSLSELSEGDTSTHWCG